MRYSTNYNFKISEFNDPKGPGGWDADYGYTMDLIDSKIKLNETNNATTSSTLTTFRSGYTTVGAAITALSPAAKASAKSTPYTPTADYIPGTTYASVNGTSIAFTASGSAIAAIYTVILPVYTTVSAAWGHYYLDRGGTTVGEKRTVTMSPTQGHDHLIISYIIPSASTGTYVLKLRAYDTNTSFYMGKRAYMDGASSAAYLPISAFMYEI